MSTGANASHMSSCSSSNPLFSTLVCAGDASRSRGGYPVPASPSEILCLRHQLTCLYDFCMSARLLLSLGNYRDYHDLGSYDRLFSKFESVLQRKPRPKPHHQPSTALAESCPENIC